MKSAPKGLEAAANDPFMDHTHQSKKKTKKNRGEFRSNFPMNLNLKRQVKKFVSGVGLVLAAVLALSANALLMVCNNNFWRSIIKKKVTYNNMQHMIDCSKSGLSIVSSIV